MNRVALFIKKGIYILTLPWVDSFLWVECMQNLRIKGIKSCHTKWLFELLFLIAFLTFLRYIWEEKNRNRKSILTGLLAIHVMRIVERFHMQNRLSFYEKVAGGCLLQVSPLIQRNKIKWGKSFMSCLWLLSST